MKEDICIFFGDFGVPVVFDGKTATGILDAPGKDAMFDIASVSDIDYSLTLAANAFDPMPVSGKAASRLTVAGVLYQVRSVTPLDDGAMVDVKLRKV